MSSIFSRSISDPSLQPPVGFYESVAEDLCFSIHRREKPVKCELLINCVLRKIGRQENS